jgi:hypothetical protein
MKLKQMNVETKFKQNISRQLKILTKNVNISIELKMERIISFVILTLFCLVVLVLIVSTMSDDIIELEKGFERVNKEGIQPFIDFIEAQEREFFKAKDFVTLYE